MLRKKNVFVFGLVIISVLVVAVGINFGVYMFSTMSAQNCVEYCVENFKRGATQFSCLGDGRYTYDYNYWIAVDGNEDEGQEAFVFKKVRSGIFDLNRYKFVVGSNQGSTTDSRYGSLEFFTRNDKGEKETKPSLIYFGSLSDADVFYCEYKLTVSDGNSVLNRKVIRNDNVWIVKFFDTDNSSEETKKIISDVKFYNSNKEAIT